MKRNRQSGEHVGRVPLSFAASRPRSSLCGHAAFVLQRCSLGRNKKEGREKMNLSLSQTNALLRLGESTTGHNFFKPDDLTQLLELGLVYWRRPDEIDFTPAGAQVYSKLAGTAKNGAAKSR
jgi:hypothetical protein